MIEKVIEYSIRNRFLVLLLAGGLTVASIHAVLDTPMDAIPDLSENQVIVFTDWMGRSPQEIEDQVTYPLSLKLQGLAGIKAVRSTSEINYSMITLIFEDSINFYFARERVLEKLGLAATFLPPGVVAYLAPDATSLGQVFWYTLEGGNLDPGQMCALQKFYVGPELNSVAGVAEVGMSGGLPREYQIDVDPTALRAYNVTLGELYEAVARSNSAVGGRVIQKNNAEFLVRSIGWITGLADIENVVIKEREGTPIFVKNVAAVQVGTGFRRNVFEKDGQEVVGGVVVMRHGENPLAVIDRVKKKIQDIQPGLPPGVHIVPAYDRSHLIHGAIDSLSEVMWHEMAIAAVAVFLILWHFRSALIICITLPLAVLFSFLQMWLLRKLGIIDIQANIMSLSGITISIGILVDQAIVMVENASHHLKAQFGEDKVRGDTRAIVAQACRTVGRPIFFSVLIILLSFIPVFALSGREGKTFHPMAFTKSLAMVGVALISVTVVPALIPTFLKGRLKSEEQNWIVRSFINIYKPVLNWALDRRIFVMWAFAALLILAAGLFPIQALFGLGASHYYWEILYLITVVGVIGVVLVVFILDYQRELHERAGQPHSRGRSLLHLGGKVLVLASLVLIARLAYDFPKIGQEFMPALNEGTVMDMPITVARASVTQVADDLKARDAILRGFPEVESVIGKAGRADTPTDPAPLDMVETFINYRPRETWPKRVLKFDDASRQVRRILSALEGEGFVHSPGDTERDLLINDVAAAVLPKFDEVMRSFALTRFREFETALEGTLTRFAVADTVARFEKAGDLHWPPGIDKEKELDDLAATLQPTHGHWLSRSPALEDVSRLTLQVAKFLQIKNWLHGEPAQAMTLKGNPVQAAWNDILESLGAEHKTFNNEVFLGLKNHRLDLWRDRVKHKINWELFDLAVETFTWQALVEVGLDARAGHWLSGAARGSELASFLDEVGRAGKERRPSGDLAAPFAKLCKQLEIPFAKELFLWRRQPGAKGDLLQELDHVLQVPGWSNIWTQPIANRIDMLSTGIRTAVGVKVFGPDQKTIYEVSQEVKKAIEGVKGAVNVTAEQIMGEGYLEIRVDRPRAARYGINVGDIQDTIEVALGGRTITSTVEGRYRFPVRIRYARDFREDEEKVRRLLVSGTTMSSPSRDKFATSMPPEENRHRSAPGHSQSTAGPLQIPLGEVAQVRIVEGPTMVRSENGRLASYVYFSVSGNRDLVGLVEEAQRVVSQKVSLPAGVHLEWSGQFEHQIRAAKTLRVILPAVVLLIFLILYLTYKDLMDAGLMMLAVPEALAGGVFFQFFFPKFMHGWDTPPLDFSVPIWVGYIAAFGMATETGIIMLVYLREAIDKRGGLENIKSLAELRQAVIEGAVHRLRPKLLTEGVAIIALAPMLFSRGVGSEIFSAMALPVLGGLLIADEVVDIFLPVRFYWVRRGRWLKLQEKMAPGTCPGM